MSMDKPTMIWNAIQSFPMMWRQAYQQTAPLGHQVNYWAVMNENPNQQQHNINSTAGGLPPLALPPDERSLRFLPLLTPAPVLQNQLANPCVVSLPIPITSTITTESLQVWGKSIDEFFEMMRKFGEKFQGYQGCSPSTAAAELASKLFVDNGKKLYVLVTDNLGTLLMNSKPEMWTIMGESKNLQDTTKQIEENQKVVAVSCSVGIGNAQFSVFLFSPMDVTFTMHKNGGEVISLFYHGERTTESVKFLRNWNQTRITIGFTSAADNKSAS